MEKNFIPVVHQNLGQKEDAVGYFFAVEITNIVDLGLAVHCARFKTSQNMLYI